LPSLPRSLTRASRSTLDPADFSPKIDNPYWPMKPGSRWAYLGEQTTE